MLEGMSEELVEFNSSDYLSSTGNVDYSEDDYPFLVNDLITFIDTIKSNNENKDLSLIEIAMEFAFKNNIDVEAIGDAISSDVYFKSFIEKDCINRRIFKSDNYVDFGW